MDVQQFFADLSDVPWLLTTLDLIGIFFFATSGALLASRKEFDLVGSMALALLAGLGGGFTRDILLDRGLPASLENPIYLAPPVLVSLLVYVKALHPNRLNLTITLFDAGGLALFTVSGVLIAHSMDVHPVSTVVVAMVAALGGGVLRDIVANEVPSIFDPRGVYVMPTFVGATVATIAAMNGVLNAFTGFLIAFLIFAVRMLAYRYQWRLFGADISQDKESLDRLRRLATQAQDAAARRVERARERRLRSASGPGGMDVGEAEAIADRAAHHPPAPAGYHYDAVEDAYTRDRAFDDDGEPEAGSYGPRQEYEGQVRVEDYDPDTQSITVVDPASRQQVRLDPATGVMDVTDLRTGRTRSYDDPEHDWIADDAEDDPRG
ncbi:trimeric intracellular cation channel family protein [Micrococcus sp. HG099]|uniref:trimeric intracellular cation channel family protein n=1 Tax=Micrococcus sp. HG099 TaxID=2969755 RepID=UPI00215B1AFB|nr:trimeric intracellular cation channel family protein [Micrococcus sp. HG099]MCR8675453.1 trimeric intracellular cation channel family protein [Micrococcus sp. HG099]